MRYQANTSGGREGNAEGEHQPVVEWLAPDHQKEDTRHKGSFCFVRTRTFKRLPNTELSCEAPLCSASSASTLCWTAS